MAKRIPLAAAFAETLEQLRERAGLTIPELSAASGIDRRYLERLEAGLHLPGAVCIWRLARALGLRPSELVRAVERQAWEAVLREP